MGFFTIGLSDHSDFGLRLSKDMSGVIEHVDADSSADIQGLKRLDQIFCIDQKNVLEEDAKVIRAMLDDATNSNLSHLEIGVIRPKKFALSQRKSS